MDTLNLLLQGLFLAVALGASYAQDTSESEVTIPSDPGFPESAANRSVESPIPIKVLDRPSCAKGLPDPSAPCEEDQEYDDNVRNLVSRLLARSDPGLSDLLNDQSLTQPPAPSGFTPSVRFDFAKEYAACASSEHTIFPKRARNSKNEWRFVVNQEGARQAMKVKKCIMADKPCRFGGPKYGDVSRSCRQEYIYKETFVLGSNQIESEEVAMPSNCVCYIRGKKFYSASHTGNGTSAPQSQPIDV